MTEKLQIGLIGCGAIAEQHLRAIRSLDAVSLVGVCDRSPITAEWMAGRFETTAFADHRALLEAAPQVIHVLTPPSSHVALALDALGAGAHVIVEKPLAADAAEATKLLTVASDLGLIVVENQNYRFNDEVRALRAMIDSGRLGTLVEVEIRLVLDVTTDDRFANPALTSPVAHLAGGVIRDFLPHVCGLALHLTGEVPITVLDARWRNRSGISALGFDGLDARCDSNGVDTAIRFSAASRPEGFRITARGSAGTAEVDLFQPHRFIETQRGPDALSPLINLVVNGSTMIVDAGRGLRNKLLQHGPYHGVARFLDATYVAIRTGNPPPVTAEQIIATARLVDDLVERIDTP